MVKICAEAFFHRKSLLGSSYSIILPYVSYHRILVDEAISFECKVPFARLLNEAYVCCDKVSDISIYYLAKNE